MMLQGKEASLPMMLACREARVRQQARFLAEYQVPLVSFTLNIPGPVKTTPQLQKLFASALQQIKDRLQAAGLPILAGEEKHAATGDEALLAVQGEAAAIKAMMTALEEAQPLGRLCDIDVIAETGRKLARRHPRQCLLCGRQAQDCARSRRHTVAELTAKIQDLLDSSGW
jgi:holo-ACP synthase CitX